MYEVINDTGDVMEVVGTEGEARAMAQEKGYGILDCMSGKLIVSPIVQTAAAKPATVTEPAPEVLPTARVASPDTQEPSEEAALSQAADAARALEDFEFDPTEVARLAGAIIAGSIPTPDFLRMAAQPGYVQAAVAAARQVILASHLPGATLSAMPYGEAAMPGGEAPPDIHIDDRGNARTYKRVKRGGRTVLERT